MAGSKTNGAGGKGRDKGRREPRTRITPLRGPSLERKEELGEDFSFQKKIGLRYSLYLEVASSMDDVSVGFSGNESLVEFPSGRRKNLMRLGNELMNTLRTATIHATPERREGNNNITEKSGGIPLISSLHILTNIGSSGALKLEAK